MESPARLYDVVILDPHSNFAEKTRIKFSQSGADAPDAIEFDAFGRRTIETDEISFAFPFDSEKPLNNCDRYAIHPDDPVYTIRDKIAIYTGIDPYEQFLFVRGANKNIIPLGFITNYGQEPCELIPVSSELTLPDSEATPVASHEFWTPSSHMRAKMAAAEPEIFLISIRDYFAGETLEVIRRILAVDDGNSRAFMTRLIWRYWPHLHDYSLVKDYFSMPRSEFGERYGKIIKLPSRFVSYTFKYPVFTFDNSLVHPTSRAIVSATISTITLDEFVPHVNSIQNLRDRFESVAATEVVPSVSAVFTKSDMNFAIPTEYIRVTKFADNMVRPSAVNRPGNLRLQFRVKMEDVPTRMREKGVGSRNIEVDLARNGVLVMTSKWEEQLQISAKDLIDFVAGPVNKIIASHLPDFPSFNVRATAPKLYNLSMVTFRVMMQNPTTTQWTELRTKMSLLISCGIFATIDGSQPTDSHFEVTYISSSQTRYGINLHELVASQRGNTSNDYAFLAQDQQRNLFDRWRTSGPIVAFDFDHSHNILYAECKSVSSEHEYYTLGDLIEMMFRELTDSGAEDEADSSSAPAEDRGTGPKTLAQIDPFLFGPVTSLSGETLRYSRICEGAEHQVVPVFDESSLNETQRSRMFALKNMTYGGIQKYYCPTAEFPYMQLKHVIGHPHGLCLPCCAKKPMAEGGAKWPKYQECMKKMDVAGATSEATGAPSIRKAVFKFGDTKLPPGRRMLLPKQITNFLGTEVAHIRGVAASGDVVASFLESIEAIVGKSILPELARVERQLDAVMHKLEELGYVVVVLELEYGETIQVSIPRIHRWSLKRYLTAIEEANPIFLVRDIHGDICPILIDAADINLEAARKNCYSLFTMVGEISARGLGANRFRDMFLSADEIRNERGDLYEYVADVSIDGNGSDIVGGLIKWTGEDREFFVPCADSSSVTSSQKPRKFNLDMLGTVAEVTRFVETKMPECSVGRAIFDPERQIGIEIYSAANRSVRKMIYCVGDDRGDSPITLPIPLRKMVGRDGAVDVRVMSTPTVSAAGSFIDRFKKFRVDMFGKLRGNAADTLARRLAEYEKNEDPIISAQTAIIKNLGYTNIAASALAAVTRLDADLALVRRFAAKAANESAADLLQFLIDEGITSGASAPERDFVSKLKHEFRQQTPDAIEAIIVYSTGIVDPTSFRIDTDKREQIKMENLGN